MPDLTNMITLTEYCSRTGRNRMVVAQKCSRGTMPGAVKMGRDWFIPADAPYPDGRVKSGKYRNWRKKPSDSSDSPGSE